MEKDKLNRAQLAAKMRIALPTVDDWVRRGCPVETKDRGRGQPCKFSLSAVRLWRINDLKSRGQDSRIHDDPSLFGLQHLNLVRSLIEDSVQHFLWYSWTLGTPLLIQEFAEQGLAEPAAKRLVATAYLYFASIFERWLNEDTYNQCRVENEQANLDELMRGLTCGIFRGKSGPPDNFDLNTIKLPKPIERLVNEHRAKRLKKAPGQTNQ